jgi:hypothetical protein
LVLGTGFLLVLFMATPAATCATHHLRLRAGFQSCQRQRGRREAYPTPFHDLPSISPSFVIKPDQSGNRSPQWREIRGNCRAMPSWFTTA